MLDILIGVPPIIHTTTATSGDVAVLIIGLVIAFVLLATVILLVAARRSVQKQSQMQETEQPYEALIQPKGGEQPQVLAPEEEKVLVQR